MKFRRGLAVAASMGVLLLPTACGGDSSDSEGAAPESDISASTIKKAESEGAVTLYAAVPPEVLNLITEKWSDLYPDIKLNAIRLVDNEAQARLEQERDGGEDGADIWLTTQLGWLEDRAAEGDLDAPESKRFADWPADYIRSDTIPVLSLESFVISYNPDLVDDPPTGYADLLKPEFSGKIGLSEPVSQVVVAWYDWLEKTQGPDYLTKLAAQKPIAYVGATPIGQAVVSGEVEVGAFGVPSAVGPLKAQGAPIDTVSPSPNLGFAYGAGLLGWAKHPNAAQVLLDYLMSPEIQAVWNSDDTGTTSPLPGVSNTDVSTIEMLDPTAYPPDVVNAFVERWNGIFRR
jgi:iron(III) transport system substrate-binding protein